MRYSLRILWFSISFLLSGWMSAQIIGADIDYKCLGNDRYEVIAHIKRFADTVYPEVPEIYYKTSGGTAAIDSVSLVKYYRLDSLQNQTCTPFDTLFISLSVPKIVGFDYRGIIDLSTDTNCEVTLFIREPNTNNYLSTGNRSWIYVAAVFNKCLDPCGASPVSISEIPVYAERNQEFWVNAGVRDIQQHFDSISYSFTSARIDDSVDMDYSGNFSLSRWCTFFGFPNQNLQWPGGLRIDPVLGDIKFRPTVDYQGASYVVRVNLFKRLNGIMALVSYKDIERFILVRDAPNNFVPAIVSPYTYQYCANQEKCFYVEGNDNDADDSLTLRLYSPLLDSMKIDTIRGGKRPQLQVCWTPKMANVRTEPYLLYAEISDNNCPINGRTMRTFSLFVNPDPSDGYTLQNDSICNAVQVNLPLGNVIIAQWRFIHSTTKDTVDFVRPSGNVDLTSGKNYLTLFVYGTNGCFRTIQDSVTLAKFNRPKFNSSPAVLDVCEGSSDTLLFWNTEEPYTYLWSDGSIDSMRINLIDADTINLNVLVSNNGCSTLQRFSRNPLPQVPHSLTLDNSDSCAYLDMKVLTSLPDSVYSVNWHLSSENSAWDTLIHSPYARFDLNTGTYYSMLRVVHQNNCEIRYVDTLEVAGTKSPAYKTTEHFAIGCEGDAFTLGIEQAQSSYQYLWNDGLADSARIISIGFDTLKYSLEIRNGTCVITDSFWVYASEKPALGKSYSWIGKDSLQISLLNPLPSATYLWYLDFQNVPLYSGSQILIRTDDRIVHTVKLKAINYQCVASSEFTVNPRINTGIRTAREIAVYPNPFTDRIHLPKLDYTSIHLYTFAGQEIEIHLETTQNEIVVIPNTELSTGAYLLRLEDGQTSYRIRLIHH